MGCLRYGGHPRTQSSSDQVKILIVMYTEQIEMKKKQRRKKEKSIRSRFIARHVHELRLKKHTLFVVAGIFDFIRYGGCWTRVLYLNDEQTV